VMGARRSSYAGELSGMRYKYTGIQVASQRWVRGHLPHDEAGGAGHKTQPLHLEVDRLEQGKEVGLPDLVLEEPGLEYGEPHRFINLTGTSKNTLILHPGQAEYKWPKELRHAQCNLNYWTPLSITSGYRHLFGLRASCTYP